MRTVSGAQYPSDPTAMPGQYPDSLFGVGLPEGTGAAGGPGQYTSAEDAGDTAVTVTDPVGTDRVVQADLYGADDSTTYNTQYGGKEAFSGVDLTGFRPGGGHVRGPGHPNATHSGEPQ